MFLVLFARDNVALFFYNGVLLFWTFATTLASPCFVGVVIGNISHKILLLSKFDCISQFHSLLLVQNPYYIICGRYLSCRTVFSLLSCVCSSTHKKSIKLSKSLCSAKNSGEHPPMTVQEPQSAKLRAIAKNDFIE